MTSEIQYPINDEGITLLKESETGKIFRSKAYYDKHGKVWTIGYGFTKGVYAGMTMTREEGDRRLAKELEEYVHVILDVCEVAPNPNQLAAMACLAWNIGLGWKGTKKPKGAKDGFRQSTVLKAHNKGDFNSAARAFRLWNQSGGVELLGLTRRRDAESALYLKPVDDEVYTEEGPMPQSIDPESKMKNSTIVNASGATLVASAMGAATQVAAKFSELKDSLGDMMPYATVAFGVLAAGLAAYVIYERLRQRRNGWA